MYDKPIEVKESLMGKKAFLTLITILFSVAVLFASNVNLKQADDLYWTDRLEEAKSFIHGELTKTNDPQEKAELLWRLSRVTLAIGDELKEEGASDALLFATYEEAEKYANDAIDYKPLASAYVYRASSIGRWGETKGPLNALSKAKPMREDFAYVIDNLGILDDSISWYVLGQLYFQLPGWPISFGNLDTAISYARKAIDTIPQHALYPGHFKALATMLWKRDLSASKRSSKINSLQKDWNKANKGELDKHSYYEGANGAKAVPFYSSVALDKMSDRQEAQMLLAYAVAKYDVWPFHSRADQRNYNEIQSLLKSWGF
ncbi:MAG: hypothetical protein PHS67_04895 [Sphaerochaetaceae bacterium]|nr:hypothetical protein [Sphaerochaetaceae bacterium]